MRSLLADVTLGPFSMSDPAPWVPPGPGHPAVPPSWHCAYPHQHDRRLRPDHPGQARLPGRHRFPSVVERARRSLLIDLREAGSTSRTAGLRAGSLLRSRMPRARRQTCSRRRPGRDAGPWRDLVVVHKAGRRRFAMSAQVIVFEHLFGKYGGNDVHDRPAGSRPRGSGRVRVRWCADAQPGGWRVRIGGPRSASRSRVSGGRRRAHPRSRPA